MTAPGTASIGTGYMRHARALALGMALLLCAVVPGMASYYLAGNTQASQSQMQGIFAGSSNSYIASNSSYFAGMSTFESGGNTAITNGNTVGVMQMTPTNIYNTTKMDVNTFAQQSPTFQANAYSIYFGKVMNEPAEQELLQKQANGELVGGQPVTNGMIVGCAQLGNPNCQKQIDTNCGSSGRDGNGTSLCAFANQADKNAGKGGANTNSTNSTNSTNTTPSNPARSNPCTCPGNRQGTDAELMKESCPTNTSTYQNWPHTGIGYIGTAVPKVTEGTNVCDPSAPSRVPNPSDAAPMSTPVTSANSTNSTNSSPTGSGTGGAGANGSTVANLDKANALVANQQCGHNGLPGCECVALVQNTSNVGSTSTWSAGDSVQGNTSLQQGTVIATFNSNGDYTNTYGQSHAAIYMGQNAQGIQVIDQWNSQPYAAPRTIPWSTGNAESGSNFKVVTH